MKSKAVNSIDGPNESDLGRVIVDAAVEAGVLHFVYSGFEGAHKITNGAISNKAFDGNLSAFPNLLLDLLISEN